MMRILALMDHYLPGYKAGGPVRSLSGLVEALADHAQFYIVALDRDHTDIRPYPDIHMASWNDVGRAKVWYLPAGAVRFMQLVRVCRRLDVDAVYLSGVFSALSVGYLFVRRLGLVPCVPVVLAPRGELSPGALGIRRRKKRVFLWLAKVANWFDQVVWQASADLERGEIQSAIGPRAEVVVARNISGLGARSADPRRLESLCRLRAKTPGSCTFIFVSRISPKKNLEFLLRCLRGIAGTITLNIVGPIDDAAYWKRCNDAIAALPSTVSVIYIGARPHGEIAGFLEASHFFVFPTLGENFGHSIHEALLALCPVVLSNTTPWTAIQSEGAGWTLPLGDEAPWIEALQRCVDMSEVEYRDMAARTETARAHFMTDDSQMTNLSMFQRAISGGAGGHTRTR